MTDDGVTIPTRLRDLQNGWADANDVIILAALAAELIEVLEQENTALRRERDQWIENAVSVQTALVKLKETRRVQQPTHRKPKASEGPG